MIFLKSIIICMIFLFCCISEKNSMYFKHLKSSCNNKTCQEQETLLLLYNVTEEEWLKTGCHCDEKFHFYEDCCADNVSANKNMLLESHRCAKIKGKPIFIYEIHLCPADFPDKNIRNLCETSNNTFSKIRVTNIETKTTYSNFYCAICNGENETEITLWNLIVECPSENFKFLIENSKNNSMEQKVESNSSMIESCISNSTDIRLIPPLEMKNYLRRCKPCISGCDNTWTNDDDEVKKCQMAPLNHVYYKSQCYRNEFCAICNSVDMSNLTCGNHHQETNLNEEISYDPYQWKFGLNLNCTEFNKKVKRPPGIIFRPSLPIVVSCEIGYCLDENNICVPCGRRKRTINCFTKYILKLDQPISKWQLYFDIINIQSDMLQENSGPIG